MKLVLSCALGILLVACSVESKIDTPKEPRLSYSADQLQGRAFGEDVKFISGVFEKSYFFDDRYNITVYSEEGDPCDLRYTYSGPVFMTSILKTVGEENFRNTGRTATFSSGSNNKVTDNVKVKVRSVSESELSAQLVATYNSDNAINGTFKLKSCN